MRWNPNLYMFPIIDDTEPKLEEDAATDMHIMTNTLSSLDKFPNACSFPIPNAFVISGVPAPG